MFSDEAGFHLHPTWFHHRGPPGEASEKFPARVLFVRVYLGVAGRIRSRTLTAPLK
jgi:hypothetical protein